MIGLTAPLDFLSTHCRSGQTHNLRQMCALRPVPMGCAVAPTERPRTHGIPPLRPGPEHTTFSGASAPQ
jgi:hypothetical protein